MDYQEKIEHSVVSIGKDLELPACKECGAQAAVFKYTTRGGVKVLMPITTKVGGNSYVLACLFGCQDIIGPAPTISLLADIWRLKNE